MYRTGSEFAFFLLVVFLTIKGASYIQVASVLFYIVNMLISAKDGKIEIKRRTKRHLEIYGFILYGIIISLISLLEGKLQKADWIIPILISNGLLLGAISFRRLESVNLNSFIECLKGFGVICSIYGIIEYCTRTNITFVFLSQLSQLHLAQEGRIMTVFSHPIIYSCFLAFVFLCLIYFPYSNKFVNTGSMTLILINIILTKSRTCLLALVFLLFVKILKLKGITTELKKKKVLNMLILIIVYIVVFCVVFREQFFTVLYSIIERMGKLTREGQNIRIDIIDGYIDYILSPVNLIYTLFGAGAGYSKQFVKSLNILNGWWDTTTDSMLITLLLNYGIIGIIPFFQLVKEAFCGYVPNENSTKNLGCAYLIFLMVSSITFESLDWSVVMYLFVLSIVLMDDKNRKEIDNGTHNI